MNHDFLNQPIALDSESPNSPFFTVSSKKDEELLKWLTQEVQWRKSYYQSHWSRQRMHLKAYMNGYHKKGGGKRQSDTLETAHLNVRTSKYVVNYIYEMVENLVSRITRNKPAVDVVPTNGEYSDRNAAKAVKLLIDHLWYINDVDFMIQKLHRQKYIFGEAFLEVGWDEHKGDLDPNYVILRDSGAENKVPKGVSIKTGDVCYRIWLPWNVMMEPKECKSQVTNLITCEQLHVDEAADKYKKFKKRESSVTAFNTRSYQDEVLKDHIEVYTLHHIADKHHRRGMKVVFTEDQILEKGELGFSHGILPLVHLTDIDNPMSATGESRLIQSLNLQVAHNNLSQTIMGNEFLMGAPKWVFPKGSVKPELLNNGRTMIQYQGAQPPMLVQMNPTSASTYNFREMIKNEMGDMMNVGDISRGEPPRGVTAAVALQFLNEQETQRSISDISKHNQMVVDIARLTIATAADYYDPEDGRMLRILGEENQYHLFDFENANLHKDYDVRIQNASALPQSKAARIERVLQTMQYAPQLFTPERWAELLEFGDTEKMNSLLSTAIRAAESENEDLLAGRPVEEPKEWEDLITHLRIHYKKMQERSFKEEVPEEQRQAFELHVEVTEMLAAEKAQENPLFQAKLAQLEQFPIFWKSGLQPQSEAQQIAGGVAPAQEPEMTPDEQTQKIR